MSKTVFDTNGKSKPEQIQKPFAVPRFAPAPENLPTQSPIQAKPITPAPVEIRLPQKSVEVKPPQSQTPPTEPPINKLEEIKPPEFKPEQKPSQKYSVDPYREPVE